MRNESDFKTIFKKSIKAEKGFSISLAAPTIAGLPDLFVIYPGFLPCMLEAKFLKEATAKFDRKINYSALQVNWLEECNKAMNFTAFGLIGFKWQSEYFAVLTPFHVTRIDYLFASKYPHCLYNPKTKLFDVKYMFGHSSLPRIQTHKTLGSISHLTETKICATEAV